jgi:hypothetical protein
MSSASILELGSTPASEAETEISSTTLFRFLRVHGANMGWVIATVEMSVG